MRLLAHLRGVDKSAVAKALKEVGLDRQDGKHFAAYSLGMKQRLGIAAAVMHQPRLLILDGPINGLDPIGIHQIREYLLDLSDKQGVSILISSHLLSEVEQIADVIGVMHEGKLQEEVDMPQLKKRLRRFAQLQVSDAGQAAYLLQTLLLIPDYRICDQQTIRLYSHIEECGLINKLLVEGGVLVSGLSIKEESLEGYFAQLIGGNEIA